jgi:hypothetical protein
VELVSQGLWQACTSCLRLSAKKEIVLLTTEKIWLCRKRTAEEVAAGEELEKLRAKEKKEAELRDAAAEQYNQRMEALESKREISATRLTALSVEELFKKKEDRVRV